MSAARRRSEPDPTPVSSGRGVGPRLLVLIAFAATLAIAGPKTWRVARAALRADASSGVPVAVDRVGLVGAPDWVRGATLRAVLRDLEPRLGRDVRMLDDDGARALQRRLESSAFVRHVAIERRFPDRFRVALDLRRPAARLVVDGKQVALVDARGVLLPDGGEPLELPAIVLDGPWILDPRDLGRPVEDARVRAAVRVAVEWRDRIAPAVAAAPELVEVDARNLGWAYVADPRVSQIVVVLRRADGGVASFHYGRAEDDGGPVSAAVRADVLRRILAEFPGLAGIDRGDLRLLNLWREQLHPQPVAQAR